MALPATPGEDRCGQARGVRRDRAREPRRSLALRAALAGALTTTLVAGCYRPWVLSQSEGHITSPAAKPTVENVPPPARISSFVPPPKPAVKPPTYSVVVNEVPVKELLFALARDTKQNIDIHPGLQGVVSLNAIHETLPAILDRLSKQVDLRYRTEGNTIIVSPDTPYMKTYRVNYVNMTRETTSTIGVSGQIQTGAPGSTTGGTAGGAPSGTAGQSNASSTTVTTRSNNNFWDSLRDNIRSILASTRSQSMSAESKAQIAETQRTAREERLAQAEAASRAGAGATQLFTAAFGSAPAPILPGDVREDIIINPAASPVSVLASEKQHALIQQHIDAISQSVQRQVLIEATIAEVTLSDAYQGGIDWSRLPISGGLRLEQSLLGSVPSAFNPGSLTIGYINSQSPVGNIAATIKLLNQFGNTRVLSSPKLMALNNQTALLKVVDNLIYFSIEASQSVTQGATAQVFNTTAHTVPVGMVMNLTPQINDNGQVTLTVRPTVTRILSFANDPNPSLCSADILKTLGKCVTNPVPQIQTREMESVLQLVSGQTAILGGLMQDNIQYNRNAVPGVGNVAGVGELFSMRDDKLTKSELVIFLRSTIINNPSLDSDELKFYQRFLPQQSGAPTETVPGEMTGKIR